MATLLTVNASDVNFYIGGTKVGAAENGEFSLKRELRDAFSKDSEGWDEKEYGKGSWEMSGNSKFRFDEPNYGPDDFIIAMISGTKIAISFSTEETGDYKLSGTALVDDFKMSGNAEDTMVYSYHVTGSGKINKLAI